MKKPDTIFGVYATSPRPTWIALTLLASAISIPVFCVLELLF